MKYAISIILLLVSTESFGQELVLRADKTVPMVLPNWSKMPSTSPVCNDKGVSTKFLSLFGGEKLYPAVLQKNMKKSVFSKPFAADLSISDLHLTSDQDLIFALNYRGGTEGIFSFDESGRLEKTVSPDDFPDALAMSRPSLVDGKILFRSLNKDGLHTVYLGSKAILNEQDDIAYLYLPTSKKNQIVLKVGQGVPGEVSQQNPDKIISIFKGKVTTVAVDKDFDASSPFISFDNSPAPGGDGSVAFVAEHEEHGRSLWLFKDGEHHLVFSGSKSSYKLEYFSPALNSSGFVVFRVIKNKRRSVLSWLLKNKSLRTLMSQGQLVDANEENIKVIDRDGWPAFAGAPCVSESGTAYIHAVLESSLKVENKGSGVFKLRAL